MTTHPKAPVLILGREPAVLAHVIAAGLAVLALVLPLSDGWQVAANTVVVAAAGLYTAWKVHSEKLLPAILAFGQAVLSLAMAYGADLSANDQSVILAFVATVAGLVIRTQVAAPVTAGGHYASRAA